MQISYDDCLFTHIKLNKYVVAFYHTKFINNTDSSTFYNCEIINVTVTESYTV